MGNLADAFVSVQPDMRGFGPKVDKELGRINAAAGGRKVGESIGRGAKEGMASKFSELAKGVVAPLLGLFAVDKAREFFASAIEGASDTAEAQSKVGVVFGTAASQIVAASQTSAASMGLSKRAYLDATGTLGNLFVALKLPPKAAADMSQKMVGLAGDLASFNNVRPEDALEALRAGLTGETEPLRKFGVNLNEASIKAEALRLGLVKSTGDTDKIRAAQIRADNATRNYTKALKEHGRGSDEATRAQGAMELANIALGKAMKGTVPQLTAAQKAQASYSLIMQQTKTAQGDFTRTSAGLANSQRILSARFDDAKAKIGQAFLPIVTNVVHFLSGTAIPAFTSVATGVLSMGQAFGKHRTTIEVLATAMGALLVVTKAHSAYLAVQGAGGMLAYLKGLSLVSAYTKVATAVQWAYNIALKDNPIGLVVTVLGLLVGATVLAYKNSATFRAVVQGAWSGIKTAASAAWGVIRPVFAAIGGWITGTLIPAFSNFWHNGAVPAFNGIVGAARTFGSALGTAFSTVSAAVRAAGAFFSGLWHTYAVPAFNGVRAAAGVMGAGVQAVGSVMSAGIKAVGSVFSWLWRNIAVPVFNGVAAAVRLAWSIIKPIMILERDIILALGRAATTLWRTYVMPAFAGITNVIRTGWAAVRAILTAFNTYVRVTLATTVRWLWTNVIRPTWDTIKRGLQTAWNGIRTIWDSIRTYIRTTFHAAITWLWTNSIRPTWNTIKAGISSAWTNIHATFQKFGAYFRSVLGPAFSWLWNNGIRPPMNTIRTGISAAWTNIKGTFDKLRTYLTVTVPHAFRTGVSAMGTAWNKLKDAAKVPVNFMILTVYDKGIRGVFDKVASVVGSKARLPYIGGLKAGGPVPLLPGSRADRDSVAAVLQPGEFVVRQDGSNIAEALQHFGAPGYIGGGLIGNIGGLVSKIGGALKGAAGAVVTKAGDVTGWIQGMLAKVTGPIISNVRGLLGGLGNSGLGNLMKSSAGYLINALKGYITRQDAAAPAAGGGAYTGPVPGGGSVTRWSSTVLRALSMLHQSPSWLSTVLRRLNQESGGNPNAINNWDINAQNGVPSQGLMQVIPPTFAAYAGPLRGLGIRNPLANVYAGLNYAIHRYGSLSALNRPGGYDTGGILNPGQIGANYGKRPERVLSAQQTASFDRLVEMLDSGSIGRPMEVHVTNNHPVAEPASVTVNRALQFTAAIGRA